MKVAYNACFGGFGLSKSALVEIARLKGIDLTGMDFKYSCFANKDFTKTFDFSDDRTDKDLISVIESLGESASGYCADLQIEEIPDGASFEISEYDGNESVVPPRQSW